MAAGVLQPPAGKAELEAAWTARPRLRVQFKAKGISLHHAAARVAAETASHYPRMLDGRAVRDERGHIIHDGGRVVPGPSWEAVVTRIEREAEKLSKK